MNKSEAIKSMTIGYLYDRNLHEKANRNGLNYWSIYTAELLDWLGAPFRAVEPADLKKDETLAQLSVLFLPRDADASLGGDAGELERWVRSGGVLIGFMPGGMEALFGVTPRGVMTQGGDAFAVNTTFDWAPCALTRGIKTPLAPRDPLLIVSDRTLLSIPRDGGATVLGSSSEGPAVVYRRLGRGATLYFAFDPAQTAWAIHQGRPVDDDYDRDGWPFRSTDGAVTGHRHVKTLQVDEMLFLLERILCRRGICSLDRLPPRDGSPSDALFFWGGDDEGRSDGIQIGASEFMKSRGLPYHINVMPTKDSFGLSQEDARKVLANGHELSVHPDFVNGWDKRDYSREDILRQCDLFSKRFRVRPLAYAAHCFRWCGWADTPRWLSELGMIAENNRIGVPTLPGVPNPCDQVGLMWGTTFPFHYWDDHAHGNHRIEFLSLPIHLYEVGYQEDANDFTSLHAHLELSLKFRLTSSIFFHPLFLTLSRPRKAVDEILRLMKRRKANASHMGCDELARWWLDRSDSRLEVEKREDCMIARVRTECGKGVTLRIPAVMRVRPRVKVNGRTAGLFAGKGIAEGFHMLPLGAGEHEIVVHAERS